MHKGIYTIVKTNGNNFSGLNFTVNIQIYSQDLEKKGKTHFQHIFNLQVYEIFLSNTVHLMESINIIYQYSSPVSNYSHGIMVWINTCRYVRTPALARYDSYS